VLSEEYGIKTDEQKRMGFFESPLQISGFDTLFIPSSKEF